MSLTWNEKKKRIVSDSHHTVFTDGTNYLKQANTMRSREQLYREYSINRLLGRETEIFCERPFSVLTAGYGASMTEYSQEFITGAVRALQRVTGVVVPLSVMTVIPDVNTYREQVLSRLHKRILLKKNPTSLLKLLPPPLDFHLRDVSLTHSDPRPENWVVDNDEYHLIDWESGVLAPRELTIASLALYTIELNQPSYSETVITEAAENEPLNEFFFSWCVQLRRVSAASWFYDEKGTTQGGKWLAESEKTLTDH